jgi:transcriptional regulator with AAA-type ATPase domain
MPNPSAPAPQATPPRKSPAAPPTPAAFLPVLEVVKGPAAHPSYSLDRARTRIGRVGDVEVLLQDDAVSRTHAEVVYADGAWRIADLGSKNGVFVDGARVASAELKDKARIVVGNTELTFSPGKGEVSAEARLAALASWDVLAELKPEARAQLAECLRPRGVPRDGVVARQGVPGEAAIFVLSGRLRLAEVNDEGAERVLGQLGPGDVYGERALLPGQSASCTLLADSPACLLELPLTCLTEFLQRAPESSQTVFLSVRQKLRSSQIRPAELPARPDALMQLAPPAEVVIVGEDRRVLAAKTRLAALAKDGKTVLILGPEGVGKRTFARFYHQAGAHPEEPMIELSLAELEPAAIEATLFGVDADPRVPSSAGKVGYLEMLGNGTLILSHVELLDAHVQAKLLTYFKLGWFHRVYGQVSVKTSTRVVLLAVGGEADVLGKLTPELREALKDATISLPTLSSRLKDIPLLAEHFQKLHARKAGKKIGAISREAVDKLVSYAWPGNLTELENVIQRAVIVTTETELIPGDLIFVTPPEKEFHKLNLLKNERVRTWLRNPWVTRGALWINIGVVVLVMALTLYGGTRPTGHPMQEFGNNFGMLLTWLVWFPLLPISALLLGRVWCAMCPIVGIGDYLSRLGKLELPVPKLFKKLDFWLVVGTFLLLDYVEELAGVADKPLATATLLVVIIGLSALFCVVYERKTFCRYLCPLNGLLGAYSTMAAFEVRGNKKVCQTQCGEHTCFKGTAEVAGCPMFSYPAAMNMNTECMMCLNCLRSCDNRGVQVNLRPPLQELWRQTQPFMALSVFAVLLVGMMAKHQFPKLTWWQATQTSLGWSDATTHTILYVVFMLLALLPFAVSSMLSAAASQQRVRENMATYGMAFIPLAFSGHIAHLSHEFLGEGIYDLLGFFKKLYASVIHGIPIGSQDMAVSPFIQGAVVTFLKFLMVCGGMLGSLIVLVMIARRAAERNVFGRVLPHVLLLLVFWGVYLVIFTGSTEAPPGAPPAAMSTTRTVSTVAGGVGVPPTSR